MTSADQPSRHVSPELLAELFDRHAAALELYAAQWAQGAPDSVQEAFIIMRHAVCLLLIAATMMAADRTRANVTRSSSEDGTFRTIRMSVSPTAEPVSALEYCLLPSDLERNPGNAVPFYYRAMLAEVKVVPVSGNPMTGRPFVYKLEGASTTPWSRRPPGL